MTPAPDSPNEPLYTGNLNDPSGYVSAYRAASIFETGLKDREILVIGRKLCTYLLRHANGDSGVSLQDSITEADQHEPGFLRSDWESALKLAARYLCPEFKLEG